jgi:hypothetical protein
MLQAIAISGLVFGSGSSLKTEEGVIPLFAFWWCRGVFFSSLD